MSDNPLSDEFWSAEEAALWEDMAPLVLKILLDGGDAGLAALPPDVQILMNWDGFNQAIIDYLEGYRFTWIKGITATTRKQVIKILQAWMSSGESLPLLKAKLGPIFGANRAEQIAVTEVTRAYAEGNQQAWKASGVVSANRWMTARDELVCPICKPLDGMVVPVGENGFTTEEGGLGITGPAAHPNCRCWLQPVVDLDLLERELEAILNAP